MYALDEREHATVLAALRYWQREGLMSGGHEQDVATVGDTLARLEEHEIDALCERLNTAPATLAVVLEGGFVSTIISPDKGLHGVEVMVIDYDTDGVDEDELVAVDDDTAIVHRVVVEDAAIDLAETARRAKAKDSAAASA